MVDSLCRTGVALILTVSLVLTLLIGVAFANQQRKIVVVGGSHIPVFQEIIDTMWSEQYPDIAVEVIPTSGGWVGTVEQILLRQAGGLQVDIVYTATEGVPALVESRIVQSFDEILDGNSTWKNEVETQIHPMLFRGLRQALFHAATLEYQNALL